MTMTSEEHTLLLIKGTIADLPAADQAAVRLAEQQIKAVIAQNQGAGVIALALVAATIDAGG